MLETVLDLLKMSFNFFLLKSSAQIKLISLGIWYFGVLTDSTLNSNLIRQVYSNSISSML